MANKVDNSSFMEFPLAIKRQGAFLVDTTYIWPSLEAAQEYAASSPVSVIGQQIAVCDEDAQTVTIYKIEFDGSLAEVGKQAAVDGKTIVIKDGKLELYGLDAAGISAGMMPRLVSDGGSGFKLEWYTPSQVDVDTLKSDVDTLKQQMQQAQEKLTQLESNKLDKTTVATQEQLGLIKSGDGVGNVKVEEDGTTSVTEVATAGKLKTAQKISLTGDVTGQANFDGSAPISIESVLADVVAGGTYVKVTVDTKGRVTGFGALTAEDIPSLTLSKISDAGTAAAKTAGNEAGNVPVIGSDGKLDTKIMPQLTITDTFVVDSESAMLALNAQQGDVAIRSDISATFILAGTDPKVLDNWKQLPVPADAVRSVNGKTGVVVLTTDDIAEGEVNLYWTDERFVSKFATSFAEKSTDDLKEGDSNLYFTEDRVKQFLEANSFMIDGGNA